MRKTKGSRRGFDVPEYPATEEIYECPECGEQISIMIVSSIEWDGPDRRFLSIRGREEHFCG